MVLCLKNHQRIQVLFCLHFLFLRDQAYYFSIRHAICIIEVDNHTYRRDLRWIKKSLTPLMWGGCQPGLYNQQKSFLNSQGIVMCVGCRDVKRVKRLVKIRLVGGSSSSTEQGAQSHELSLLGSSSPWAWLVAHQKKWKFAEKCANLSKINK